SRRRHTRLVSDWSSDVCSSDLAAEQPGARVLSVDPSLTRPRPDQLGALAPLAGFSAGRLAELAQVAVVERAPRGSDPLRDRLEEIGRASCRGRGEISGGGGACT